MSTTNAWMRFARGTLATIACAATFAGVGVSAVAASSSVTTTTASTNTGLITAGRSRSECVTPYFNDTGLTALQNAVTKFESLTNTSVTCVSAYLNGAPTWSAWEQPWITASRYGYTSWVAQAPSRQLVLQVDLIPTDLKNTKNPVGWERSCAEGKFDAHATELGTNLVTAGLQNSVIRLGAEMNGSWEVDFVGTTTLEHHLWSQCFDNEVTSMRSAVGQHFLIDWDPNPCQYDQPYLSLYPGNAYVNIVGIDLFDVSCTSPNTPYSFARLASEPTGLTTIEAFAETHHKPLSLPEWGLRVHPSGDDPGFIDGIGSQFDTRDFAFETYFDVPDSQGTALPLGPRTPASLVSFRRWFANDSKS